MSKFLYIINIIFLIRVNPALGETEAGMPQLNPEFWISQVFWLILIFSTLYIIIWKLIIPKITESLENRKKHIESTTVLYTFLSPRQISSTIHFFLLDKFRLQD